MFDIYTVSAKKMFQTSSDKNFSLNDDSHPPKLGSKWWMSDPKALHRDRHSLRAKYV